MSSADYDIFVVIGFVLVFALPLSLLFTQFSVWDVIPKIQITRFHFFTWTSTWTEINSALIVILMLFFGIYLEVRKRKFDDMVEDVLTVSQATDAAMDVEKERQTAAVKACVELLDTSSDHYEHLVLLRDELRQRDRAKRQYPPAIELSTFDF